MGRGRGKGNSKKQSVSVRAGGSLDAESEKQKVALRRRGRPMKDAIKEEAEMDEIEEEKGEDVVLALGKSTKDQIRGAENGRKRKRHSISVMKESAELIVEKNVLGGSKSNGSVLIKSVGVANVNGNGNGGYRQNGRQRKNKPRRAAEAVVECN